MFSHTCLLVAAAALGLAAQPAHRLYVCGAASKGYVVGAKLPPSGLFTRAGDLWQQLGFNHPSIAKLDYDRRHPEVLYLAAGNGCIRSRDAGRTWQLLTSWDVTELQDVALDPHHPGTLLIALPDGIARSVDDGRTWQRAQTGLERKFTKAIRFDRERPRHLLAGTESGLFASTDNGLTWQRTAGNATMITHLEQSPHDSRVWLATTQSTGVWRSADGGVSWQRLKSLPLGEVYYQVSFDPLQKDRLALCSWQRGVRVSEDGGVTFAERSAGLPSKQVWSIRFHPGQAGRLLAAVHEEAVYASEDAGRTWRSYGVDGWIVNHFAFVPEGRP